MKGQIEALGSPPSPLNTHQKSKQKNHFFLGMAEWGITEISNTNKDLKEARVMRSTSCQFNLPVWPVKKADGSCRMIVDDYKFNQVMPSIEVALPYVVTLLQQINTAPVTDIQLVPQQMLTSPYKLVRNSRSNLLLLGRANSRTLQSCPRATSVFLLSDIR